MLGTLSPPIARRLAGRGIGQGAGPERVRAISIPHSLPHFAFRISHSALALPSPERLSEGSEAWRVEGFRIPHSSFGGACRRGAAILLLFLLLVPAAAGASHPYLWEGFEREINWDANTGTAATGRIVDGEIFSEGTRSLKLPFRTVAPSGWGSWGRNQDLDWSPFGALVLDIYNPTDLPNIRLGVVITAGDNWVAHEAFTPPLAKGWNRDVRIELKKAVFSSPASDYKPVGHLIQRGQVHRIGLNIYPGAVADGAVNIDNIRLERAGIIEVGDVTVNTTLDATASAGKIDFIPPGIRLRDRDLATLESFEGEPSWTPWAEGITVETATDIKGHGSRSLSVKFPASPDGFLLSLDGMAERLHGTRQLRMQVYCAGPNAMVNLVLYDAEWNEYWSDSYWIRHGWNTVVFDFTNQNLWNGTAIPDSLLNSLSAVAMNITSRYPGRLVFDGVAGGSVKMKTVARGGALVRGSWNPTPQLEVITDARVQDTFYGPDANHLRDSGAEGYFNSGSVRYDAGEFRSSLLYRKKATAFDHPIFLLVSPSNLGEEIAAFEAAGRVADTEVQGLVASRLEYDRYNSHVPTALGPEGLGGLRVRRDVAEGVRLGATYLDHLTRYGKGVSEVPRERHIVGIDLDAQFEPKPVTLAWAAEAAGTWGDLPDPVEEAHAPRNDRYYAATELSPEVGRLKTSMTLMTFGYDFDASFTNWGNSWDGISGFASLNLDGWGPFAALSAVPLYDRSLGNSLSVGTSMENWHSRDRYVEADGGMHPRTGGSVFTAWFSNDYKAKPNFYLHATREMEEDEWFVNPTWEEGLNLRIPLPLDIVMNLYGELEQKRSVDKEEATTNRGWKRIAEGGLERYFKGNLFVTTHIKWQKTGWEGDEPGENVRFTAGLRQSLGANSSVEVNYGSAALNGYDYGALDTINIVTVTAKTYF